MANTQRYRKYDLAHLKLVFDFSIYNVWKSVQYGVSNGLDTAYWGFLGIETTSERNNLAFFIAKRMEFITKQARLFLPYGMLLTRLFTDVMSKSPELLNDHYVLYDRVMYPFTAQQERKTRKDYGMRRGRSSTSSSSAFGQPSSFHPNDDDNDEGTSRASTLVPTRFVISLSNDIPQIFSNPPNVDPNMEAFYSRQTEILNRQV
ncbi:hypothetical protein Tco_1134379 [Tanacetum coccineum]